MRVLAWIAIVSMGCGGSSSSIPDDNSAEGSNGGPCYPNSTCNAGLVCVASICGAADAAGTDTAVVVEDTAVATDIGADTPSTIPYKPSDLTASCDMLGDGTVVAGTNADDETSAKLPLPFAFKYFGDAVTQYSMASNGFAQLWDASGGAASKTPDNVTISSAPNGTVAPFWDDLAPMFSDARAGTLGTAPNRRFVISWIHWTIKGEATSRLTFQVKLFETTNVIEFHYCAMSPDGNARATGSSATIGLFNVPGTRAVEYSLNKASAVASGKAVRFTP